MSSIAPNIQPVLADLQAGLTEFYGTRLKDIVLYGSYARGDAHIDSDIDIVVVLNGPIDSNLESDRLVPLQADLNLRYEQLVSILPVSDSAYWQRNDPFWRNVRREGISV